MLGSLFVQNFTINDGTLTFETEGAPESATVNAINLKLRDFVFNAPFTVAVTFAALSDQQNFDLSATIGPLVSNGVLDIDAIPLTGNAKVGPILLTQLKTIPMVAKSIPPKLSISGPVSFDATADGTVQSIKFNVDERFERARDRVRRHLQQACRHAAENFRRGFADRRCARSDASPTSRSATSRRRRRISKSAAARPRRMSIPTISISLRSRR